MALTSLDQVTSEMYRRDQLKERLRRAREMQALQKMSMDEFAAYRKSHNDERKEREIEKKVAAAQAEARTQRNRKLLLLTVR